ncbi:MAG: hypothetical protein U0903_01215 [Planctomycetales bacterium]
MPTGIPLSAEMYEHATNRHALIPDLSSRRLSSYVALCCWLVLGMAVGLRAEDSLLKYVPEKAGLIVRLNDWRTHAPKVMASPFWERLKQNPTCRRLMETKDFQNLVKFQQSLETAYGKSCVEFSKELSGRELVLAVFSGEVKGTAPWGLLLTRGENALSVARAVAAWKRTDPHSAENRVYKQISYQICTPHGAKTRSEDDLLCYVVLDDVIATSGNEAAIRRAIDIHTGVKESDKNDFQSILTSEEFRWSLTQAGTDCPLTLYFRPPHWDKSISGLLQGKEPAGFTKTLLRNAWKNCRAVSVGVRLDQGLVADVSLHLSPEGRQWWALLPEGKPFTPTVEDLPQQAVVAAGGRIPGAVLSPILVGLFSETDSKTSNIRDALKGLLRGLDLLRDVIPALGPEWVGGYFHGSELTNAVRSPSQFLVKTEFTDREFAQNGRPPTTLRQSLSNAARAGLHMHALLDSKVQAPVTVGAESSAEGIENLWWLQTPKDRRWCVGLTANTLWMASDPELVRRERSLSPADSIGQLPAFRDSLAKYHPSGNAFLWVDLGRWKENDVRRIAQRGGKPNHWLVLEPFQTFWLTLSHDAETVKLGAGLR